MIKTFIYGTPLGFDLYEKTVEHLDYFKGFYISSRKGRRLMVNRKNNGETTYNYLRYGLQEAAGRPNSFFGMTIMIDGNQYCPNFKVLLEWFDYLFDKLVNERQLFKRIENGTLQYQVKKFEDESSDVDWLKSNLPNILTQAQQTQLLEYDSSFADGKAGQIVSFPHDVNEVRVLRKFKENRWISVSGEIIDGDDDIVEEIELDYNELDKKLNEYSQILLPIAVDTSKGSKTSIEEMGKDVNEISSSIATYLNTVTDNNLATIFTELDGKYSSLMQTIEALLSKMAVPEKEPKHEPKKELEPKTKKELETQYCFTCKLNKPLSEFPSPDATKCIACEQQETPQTKPCAKCKKRKPLDQFSETHPNICLECDSLQTEPPKPPIPKKAIAAIAGILLLAGASVGVFKHCSSQGDKPKTEALVQQADNSTTADAINPATLDSLIATEDFSGIYDYINDKEDISLYAPKLKESVEKQLFKILDTIQGAELRKTGIQEFYVNNQNLLDLVGFSEGDKITWEGIRTDYEIMLKILNRKQLKEEERIQGQKILNQHQDLFPKDWSERLAGIPPVPVKKVETNVVNTNANQAKTGNNAQDPTTYKVTYTKAANGKSTTEEFSKIKGIEAKVGSIATIINVNTGKEIKRITVKEGKDVITLDGGIQLTITGIKKTYGAID